MMKPAKAVRTALESLRQRRPIFHSEADLQHELACELSQVGFTRVRVEFPIEGIRVDILADNNIAIELKYVPSKFSHKWEGENFALLGGEHDRSDRYKVGKDITRLIDLMESGAIKNGFVVLLTNRKRLREKMHEEDWCLWHNFRVKNGDFRYMFLDVRKFCAEAAARTED